MFYKKAIDKIKEHPYLLYTIGFTIIAIAIFFEFIITNKSFVWKPDGLKQHYAILYNYNVIIRNFLKNVTNGFPMISWHMGLGLDVIGQYSYYILGDIFAYISLIFPMKNLNIAYNALIVLRIYFIGIAFLYYCKYNKNNNVNSVLGALAYAFCSYVIFASVRHSYFSNPLIMLPLVFVGIDKFFKENKKSFFIITIFISSIMNYYFFYMITILLGIYTLIRYVVNNDKILTKKDLAKKITTAILCYIAGVMISAIVLLPTIYTFLNSSRVGYSQIPTYDISYFKNLLVGLITVKANVENHSFIGITSLILLLLPVFIAKRKKYKYVWQLFIIFLVMLLIPIIGSIMNGFSYPNNRWAFAFCFLISYIIVLTFNCNLKFSKKEILLMITSIMIYSVLLAIFINNELTSDCLISLIYAFIMLMIIVVKTLINTKKYDYLFKIAMVILITANIIFIGKSKYTTYIDEFVDNDKIAETYNNGKQKTAIKKIKESDTDFYRIGNDNIWIYNNSLVLQYNSLNYYLSLGNKYVDELMYNIGNSKYDTSRTLTGIDDRTKIITMLATKYYVINKDRDSMLPYGYRLLDKDGKTETYINENSLSAGVFYDNYTEKSDYSELTPLEKEQAILETAVLEDTTKVKNYDIENDSKITENIRKYTTQNLSYSIEDNTILENDNNIEIKNEKNNKFMIKFEPVKNSELYIEINGITYEPYTKKELKKVKLGKKYSRMDEKKFNDEYKNYSPYKTFSVEATYGNIKKSIEVYDKEREKYYVPRDTILLNLGYQDKHSGTIEIELSEIGKYKFDSINIIAVPMERYEYAINKLKDKQLENIEYGNNFLSGTITTNTSGILQITTS